MRFTECITKVRAPELVIDTFEFEGIPEPGHASMETMTLEELPGGRTRLTTQSVFQSVADRDATLAVGHGRGGQRHLQPSRRVGWRK